MLRLFRMVRIISLIISLWIVASDVLAEGGKMELMSLAFKNNQSIPKKYSCQDADISPPLQWKNSPDKTQSFALIMDDPDASNGVWDHWILFNIPNTTTQLSENLTTLPGDARNGKNSWGNLSYGGPCPPSGEHRYVFKLYALDTLLSVSAGIDKSTLETAMQGHVLATATLTGVYKK